MSNEIITAAIDYLIADAEAWETGAKDSAHEVYLMHCGKLRRDLAERLRGLLIAPDHEPLPSGENALPDDVVRLVIAAREIAFGGHFDGIESDDARSAIREIDQASEAFASRVPWDDEPGDVDDANG